MCTRYLIINRVSELKVHIKLTRFVQPEKIEIDANERAVNEKSPYCFFVCTTFDSFLNDFRIYPDYHKIYRGQTEIVLTKAEYELFMLLSGRPGVIFTKEKIFEILYNEELPESIDNIVYCLVSSMRKKIEPELKQCRYIKTVRGVGYKFEGKKMDIFPE